MSLIYIDSFDHRNWTNDGEKTTTSHQCSYLYSRHTGSQGIRVNGPGGPARFFGGLGDSGTIVTGFAMKIDYAFANDATYIQFLGNRGSQREIQVGPKSNGSLYISTDAGTIGTSAVGLIAVNVWNYIEIKAKMSTGSGVNGSVIVRLNGVPVISVFNVVSRRNQSETRWNTYDGISLNANGSNHGDYDDWYILNNTSSGLIDSYGNPMPNNDFLGDIIVATVYPTGSGSVTQLISVPGNVSNWNNVNETASRNAGGTILDTAPNLINYNYSPLSGSMDLYKYQHISMSAPGIIYGIQMVPAVWKSDTGFKGFSSVISSSATFVTSSREPAKDTMNYFSQMYESNPDTPLTGWSTSSLNAAEFGIIVKD
jgi:hypothetical protein